MMPVLVQQRPDCKRTFRSPQESEALGKPRLTPCSLLQIRGTPPPPCRGSFRGRVVFSGGRRIGRHQPISLQKSISPPGRKRSQATAPGRWYVAVRTVPTCPRRREPSRLGLPATSTGCLSRPPRAPLGRSAWPLQADATRSRPRKSARTPQSTRPSARKAATLTQSFWHRLLVFRSSSIPESQRAPSWTTNNSGARFERGGRLHPREMNFPPGAQALEESHALERDDLNVSRGSTSTRNLEPIQVSTDLDRSFWIDRGFNVGLELGTAAQKCPESLLSETPAQLVRGGEHGQDHQQPTSTQRDPVCSLRLRD